MPNSPVKRLTRSRAKATTDTEPAKAAPPKVTRTSVKRKLAAEEDVDAAVAEAPKPRGRPRKTVVTEAKVDAPASATRISARPTRGRKAVVDAVVVAVEETQPEPEAPRTTRTRTTVSKAAVSKPVRPGPKKRVTFQVDNEKENREPDVISGPPAKKLAKAESLLKSKPVRRTAATRISTRAAKKPVEESKPLSPKKFSQPTIEPDTQPEDAPKPSLSSPAKRPVSKLSSSKAAAAVTLDDDPLASEITVSPIKEFSTSLLTSPAKRLPRPGLTSSPTKGTPFKFSTATPAKAANSVSVPAPVFKLNLLSSPAKRSPEKLSFSSSRLSPTKLSLADPFAAPVLCPRQPSPVKDISDKVLFHQSPVRPKRAEHIQPASEPEVELEVEDECQADDLDKGTIFEEMDAMEEDEEPAEAEDTQDITEAPVTSSNLFEEALKRNVNNRESLFKSDSDRRRSIKAFQPETPGPLYMDESDDELSHEPASPQSPTTFIARRESASQFIAPPVAEAEPVESSGFKHKDIISMTPLVFRFGNMRFASPSKKGLGRAKRESILSPIPPTTFYGNEAVENTPQQSPQTTSPAESSPQPESQFEEAVQSMEDVEITPEHKLRLSLIPELCEEDSQMDTTAESDEEMEAEPEEDAADYSILSSDSSKENNIPVDPFLLNSPEPVVPAVTPKRHVLREFYTVSKVPLKPAAEESPVRPPIKRRGSISGPALTQDHRAGLSRSKTVISYSPEHTTDIFEDICEPITPSRPEIVQTARTPLQSLPQTPMPEIDNTILTGVVAYVDVHTAEGADASGVFVDLLTQMGARCVKQWNWNGKATAPATCPSTPAAGFGLGGSDEGIRDPVTWTPGCSGQGTGKAGSKIGITHVIFKDGGVRTLEKVREAGGIVSCVSAAWVLDCEREGRWVDESLYSVDTSIVPRGGNRRRKSMEPRALAALDNNASPSKSEYEPSPVKSKQSAAVPQTPVRKEYAEPDSMSPVTPYFLKPEQLVQKTCPPKPSQPLFPANSRLRVENDETVRQRLLNARRKSMQWAPKHSSPLVRATSYTVE